MSKNRKLRRRCLLIREKKGIGDKKGIEIPPLPEKNRERTKKMTCKSMEWEENQQKGPRWSRARNQMGNPR